MKRVCFFTVALVALFVSCSTYKAYTVPGFDNYREVINLSGMDAATIYRKTEIWVEEEVVNKQRFALNQYISEAVSISKSETEIRIGYHLKFTIKDGAVVLMFTHYPEFLAYNETKATEDATDLMERQKSFAADYKAFITAPALSQAEIDELTAKGDAAFEAEKFSEAEKYYGQVLALAPPNTDIYVAYGLSVENQVSDSLSTEQFIINTNLIMRYFNNWAEELQSNPYMQPSFLVTPYYGYDQEYKRLEEAYKHDTGKLERAMEMYNKALSLDPKNELALLCANAGRNKQRKAYIDNRYSQIKTALDNIKKTIEPEVKRIEEKRAAENWERVAQNLNQLANSIAQVQQNQSGGSAGGYSGGGSSGGQGQAGTSGSSSSSSGRDINVASMQRNYNSRSKATERALDNYRKAKDSGASRSEVDRLYNAFIEQQRSLRTYREDCNRKGADIRADFYETVRP